MATLGPIAIHVRPGDSIVARVNTHTDPPVARIEVGTYPQLGEVLVYATPAQLLDLGEQLVRAASAVLATDSTAAAYAERIRAEAGLGPVEGSR